MVELVIAQQLLAAHSQGAVRWVCQNIKQSRNGVKIEPHHECAGNQNGSTLSRGEG